MTVCGDVHGQYFDLLNIFDINGLPSQENPYLFNGKRSCASTQLSSSVPPTVSNAGHVVPVSDMHDINGKSSHIGHGSD